MFAFEYCEIVYLTQRRKEQYEHHPENQNIKNVHNHVTLYKKVNNASNGILKYL